MSFLITAAHQPVKAGALEDALKVHRSWSLQRTTEIIADVRSEHYRIACVRDGEANAYKLWREEGTRATLGSFVYVLGWCYRIGSANDELDDKQCREILHRQRCDQVPLDESYSGNYVVVVYDSKRQRLVIQPDRWAISGVYYSSLSTAIVVSNRSALVASVVSASLDGYSVLSFLRGTHMPFGRTLFADVHRLMCGCCLHIDLAAKRLDVKRIFPTYVPVENESFADGAKIIGEAVCQMARRWRGSTPSIVDMTGGNDTRLMAAAMLHENPDGPQRNVVWCVAGPEDHPDVRIASEIAKVCKWPLLRLGKVTATDASVEWLQRSIVQADATCLVDAAYARIRQELNRGTEWMWHIGAIGGEFLRGFFWQHEFLSLGKTNRVDFAALLAYRLYASREVDTKVFGGHSPSLNEHDEVLLAPYVRIGEIGQDALNPYKLDAMYMHKLCYSAGSTQSWLMGLRNLQLPLVCWEVTSKTLSLPWKLRASRRFMLKVIENLAPKLTNIPNDKGEPMKPLSLESLPLYVKSGLLTGARALPRVINRYTGGLPASRSVTINKVPASRIPVVLEGKHIDSIFDPPTIKKICDEARTELCNVNSNRCFQTMFTIELLLRTVPNICNKVTFNAGPEILS